jgi:hypothetical protein
MPNGFVQLERWTGPFKIIKHVRKILPQERKIRSFITTYAIQFYMRMD